MEQCFVCIVHAHEARAEGQALKWHNSRPAVGFTPLCGSTGGGGNAPTNNVFYGEALLDLKDTHSVFSGETLVQKLDHFITPIKPLFKACCPLFVRSPAKFLQRHSLIRK